MPGLEPTQALVTCERALRQLFRRVFTTLYGPGWLEEVASPEQIENWRLKRETKLKKRTPKGAMVLPEDDELAYAEFTELLNIAHKRWDLLAPALGKKKDTGTLLARFEDIRNSVAHSRPLLTSKRSFFRASRVRSGIRWRDT